MLCKTCNAEIPKKATRCPECGRAVVKPQKYLYPIAVTGAVISFVGGLFPAIQNSDAMKKFNPAYGFMNYEQPMVWYLFMLLLVASMLLCAFKFEKFSIITTVTAAVVYGITYNNICMRHGAPGMQNGLAGPIIITGTIVGVIGAFININKFIADRKKEKGEIEYQYTGNKTIWQRIYIYRGFYLMFLPVLIFVLIFNYLPMAGLRFAFTDYYSGKEPVYVGIKHFVDMFGLSTLSKLSHKNFLNAFTNTLSLSIIKLFLNTFMAVIISLLLNEMVVLRFKKTVQTVIYLPHFMSWVVVASIFKLILSASDSGMLNQMLMSMELIDKPIEFLTSENLWRGVYYVVNIWKDTGWGTILFLATLSGISPELYEAAQIDGANRFNRLRYITLPALANTIITVFILNLAKVMNLFESVFVMYNPSVYEVSDVLQTYIYRQSFSGGTANYGYTTAVGLFKSLVSCALVLACNRASKKIRGRGIV
ncbi:MAG: ABC transporter permease subunit [Lachnospiraceae bacterium]|nr:ABC transporter permease subunit [Lachnospiraceae bacterium]